MIICYFVNHSELFERKLFQILNKIAFIFNSCNLVNIWWNLNIGHCIEVILFFFLFYSFMNLLDLALLIQFFFRIYIRCLLSCRDDCFWWLVYTWLLNDIYIIIKCLNWLFAALILIGINFNYFRIYLIPSWAKRRITLFAQNGLFLKFWLRRVCLLCAIQILSVECGV